MIASANRRTAMAPPSPTTPRTRRDAPASSPWHWLLLVPVVVPLLVVLYNGKVPYTVIVYPMVFLVLARLWSVSHRHGFVTPADFVRARSGSSTMALLVAITGIVATMPYIALQLVGIESVLKSMHVNPTWALIIAFAILAAYTYQSGLRAPALIAFVKDSLIYLVIIVAVIYIPYKLGGWHKIFDAADTKFAKTNGTLLNSANEWYYVPLALGSALALFLYP